MTGECTYPIYHQRVTNVEMERYCITLPMENALHNLRTDTIINAGDLMLVTHLYQKARRVTHRFTMFFFTQVELDYLKIRKLI